LIGLGAILVLVSLLGLAVSFRRHRAGVNTKKSGEAKSPAKVTRTCPALYTL
jgi:hypothetical protein